MKSHHISFIHAADGIKTAFKTQPNFKIHLVFAALAITAGFVLKISSQEWTTLILTVSAVITLELINTAIEALVDITSPKISRLAKTAKDVSAAAVFATSLGALIIGLIIFLPKISYSAFFY